ncbi:hypothetical protein FRC12_011625 [Ceratobasidium sp. 428]|nr:hypothetical protein FRC12_011625 [Ceratobasidium sp. 428]
MIEAILLTIFLGKCSLANEIALFLHPVVTPNLRPNHTVRLQATRAYEVNKPNHTITSPATKDHVTLTLTSRNLSHCMVPVVWSRVDDIRRLTALVPGLSTERKESNPACSTRDADFTRFRSLATHVHRLKLFRHPSRPWRLDDATWAALVAQADASPLLPNLRQVTLYLDTIERPWHQLLVTSSLVDIQIRSLATSVLKAFGIRNILQNCSKIRTLSLITSAHLNSRPRETSSLSSFMLSCRQLRTLTISSRALNATILSSIGELSDLGMLGIYTETSSRTSQLSAAMPLQVGSFPALTFLSFVGIPVLDVASLPNLAPLFKNVTTLSFTIEIQERENLLWSMACQAIRISLNVTELCLDFEGQRSSPVEPSRAFLSSLKLLPLKTFVLNGAFVRSSVEFLSLVHNLPPELVILHIHSQMVDFEALLPVAAHLTHMRELRLGILASEGISRALLRSAGQNSRPSPQSTLYDFLFDVRIVPDFGTLSNTRRKHISR